MSLVDQLNQLYRNHVDSLFQDHSPDDAASLAVGGGWDLIGSACFSALVRAGLSDLDDVLDVGCGSGRTAAQLDGWLRGTYVGVDVAGRLVEHASSRFPAFSFRATDGVDLPIGDGSVDTVAMFSIATHVPLPLTLRHLRESRRVLRPDGRVVVSFLELAQESARGVLEHDEVHVRRLPHLDEFLHRDDLETVAELAGLALVDVIPGSEPVLEIHPHSRTRCPDLPDGPIALGQSIAVLQPT
jgi:SAM-dependent methyltransferase